MSDRCLTHETVTTTKKKCDSCVQALDARPACRHPRCMAPPRIEKVDMTYHVNDKAVDGTKLFRDDVDRESFLSLLADQASRRRLRTTSSFSKSMA